MSRRVWTDDEIKLLQALYPDKLTEDVATRIGRPIGQVYAKASHLGLKKSEAFKTSAEAGLFNGKKGANTRFVKGHRTWNTGMKGLQMGGKETQFKPGNRIGNAVEIYQPIGTEHVRDGYLYRKLRDDGPMHKRWEMVHRLNWIAAHGPIPEGHVVVFRNGNRMDVGVDNLELISRADLAARNSIHRYPPEIKALLRLNGKLRRQINDHQQ